MESPHMAPKAPLECASLPPLPWFPGRRASKLALGKTAANSELYTDLSSDRHVCAALSALVFLDPHPGLTRRSNGRRQTIQRQNMWVRASARTHNSIRVTRPKCRSFGDIPGSWSFLSVRAEARTHMSNSAVRALMATVGQPLTVGVRSDAARRPEGLAC